MTLKKFWKFLVQHVFFYDQEKSHFKLHTKLIVRKKYFHLTFDKNDSGANWKHLRRHFYSTLMTINQNNGITKEYKMGRLIVSKNI